MVGDLTVVSGPSRPEEETLARSRAQSSGDFPVPPVRRSPAPEVGPRAAKTIAKILAATRAIFLSRGYGGTTIDEIATEAGISRASFYTYFPTKRDVLLALGADSANASDRLVDGLRALDDDWSEVDIARFVDDSFATFDEHGAFAFAWTEAAHQDDELRQAGMKRHLSLCRDLGEALGRLRGSPFEDPRATGLAVNSMIERTWSYCQLYAGTVDEGAVRAALTASIIAMLRS